MPLSKAGLHHFELPSAVLNRGFWLYLWKIQQAQNTKPLFYVGMTGDTGSYSAQSPINRVSAHLGFNKRSNALRRYAEKHKFDLEKCWKIEFFTYGPISEVPQITSDGSRQQYSDERKKVAAVEKAIWMKLSEKGHCVINPCPSCRLDHDPDSFEQAFKALSVALDLN